MSPTSGIRRSGNPLREGDREHLRKRLSIAGIARRIYANKAAGWAAAVALCALSASAFYRVRELLAALLLFSILFAIVMLGAVIVWLVDEAAHRAAVRVESRIGHISSPQIAAPSQARAKQGQENRAWH